ncbi:hypothetical protein DITRI_Ditri10aG0054000 [Diplodiscus trichospermus]
MQLLKKQKEIEEEVESKAFPAFISDSNNKVRLANFAFKEMVGQLECPWLDSMIIMSVNGLPIYMEVPYPQQERSQSSSNDRNLKCTQLFYYKGILASQY